MSGFIIPDNIQKAMSNYNVKDYGKVIINVNSETVRNIDEIAGADNTSGGKESQFSPPPPVLGGLGSTSTLNSTTTQGRRSGRDEKEQDREDERKGDTSR